MNVTCMRLPSQSKVYSTKCFESAAPISPGWAIFHFGSIRHVPKCTKTIIYSYLGGVSHMAWWNIHSNNHHRKVYIYIYTDIYSIYIYIYISHGKKCTLPLPFSICIQVLTSFFTFSTKCFYKLGAKETIWRRLNYKHKVKEDLKKFKTLWWELIKRILRLYVMGIFLYIHIWKEALGRSTKREECKNGLGWNSLHTKCVLCRLILEELGHWMIWAADNMLWSVWFTLTIFHLVCKHFVRETSSMDGFCSNSGACFGYPR